MIPARPSKLLKRWFGGVVEGRVKKTFAAMCIRGLSHVREATGRAPLLFVSNHTSWWDPMFCIYLSTRLAPLDGYALMDARNLRKLAFLARLGGFGVELDDPEDRSIGLRYAAERLSGPGRGVWVFAQGRERPVTERPLAFKPGSAVVASRPPSALVVPVALRYEFRHLEKPFFYVSIGEPFAPDAEVEVGQRRHEEAVETELARIDAHLRDPDSEPGFETLLRQRRSWIGRMLERMLGWMTR